MLVSNSPEPPAALAVVPLRAIGFAAPPAGQSQARLADILAAEGHSQPDACAASLVAKQPGDLRPVSFQMVCHADFIWHS